MLIIICLLVKHKQTRPTSEWRKTLSHLRSINPNMINHFASQSQTCQLFLCEAWRASHCHSPQTTYSSKSTCCVLSAQKSAMHVVVYADRRTIQHSIVDIIDWSWSNAIMLGPHEAGVWVKTSQFGDPSYQQGRAQPTHWLQLWDYFQDDKEASGILKIIKS